MTFQLSYTTRAASVSVDTPQPFLGEKGGVFSLEICDQNSGWISTKLAGKLFIIATSDDSSAFNSDLC